MFKNLINLRAKICIIFVISKKCKEKHHIVIYFGNSPRHIISTDAILRPNPKVPDTVVLQDSVHCPNIYRYR